MSVTRKRLKSMGLTEEQVEAVMEDHLEVVDGLKKQVEAYKEDAEKLPNVQKQLDDLQKEDWKKKYEDEVTAHNTTKETHQKEANAGKAKKAVEAYFKKAGVQDKHMKHAMVYAAKLLDGVKLDKDGNISDTSSLDELIKGDVADFVTTTQGGGSNPQNPAGGGGSSANPTAAQIASNFHTTHYGKD